MVEARMSFKKYNECPFCGSTGFLGGDKEFKRDENGDLWRTATCNNCKCSWNAVYTFSHKEDVVTCAILDEKEL